MNVPTRNLTREEVIEELADMIDQMDPQEICCLWREYMGQDCTLVEELEDMYRIEESSQ